MKVTLTEFLKTHKLKLLLRRNIHSPFQYSCEILNAWMKQQYFYINAYGYGDTETKAINDFVKNISNQILVFNIDNKNKRRTLKVPFLEFVKEEKEHV